MKKKMTEDQQELNEIFASPTFSALTKSVTKTENKSWLVNSNKLKK